MTNFEVKSHIILFVVAPLVFATWAWGLAGLVISLIAFLILQAVMGSWSKAGIAIFTGLSLHAIDPTGYLNGWIWPILYWAACFIIGL